MTDAQEKRHLFIKIPGTKEGLPAIEETIASGVPVNVTLLFSREQYEAAAEAYLRGLERRLSAELSLDVRSLRTRRCSVPCTYIRPFRNSFPPSWLSSSPGLELAKSTPTYSWP